MLVIHRGYAQWSYDELPAEARWCGTAHDSEGCTGCLLASRGLAIWWFEKKKEREAVQLRRAAIRSAEKAAIGLN